MELMSIHFNDARPVASFSVAHHLSSKGDVVEVQKARYTVWGNNYPDKRRFIPKVTLFKYRFHYITTFQKNSKNSKNSEIIRIIIYLKKFNV